MKHVVSRVRDPVRREGADTYLLLTLLSFAASVSVTRLFLEVTGYPQLGGGGLHIAHVLWGGLLLFVAALLPLIYANRWVYRVGAVLAGVGVGLFIDEVGKFITQTNDYFHPAAAPIVYAFFLVTVLVYRRIRRPPLRSARAELYRALDSLEELLDHDLQLDERSRLTRRLQYVADQAGDHNLRRLAEHLLTFMEDEALDLAPRRMSRLDRILKSLNEWEVRHLTEARTRAILLGVLLAVGAWALHSVYRSLSPVAASARIENLFLGGRLISEVQLAWFSARMALEIVVGAMLLFGAVLMAAGKRDHGQGLAYLGVLLSLTTVNVLAFYFDQFSTVVKAVIEFNLLLGLLRYRSRFVLPEETG